MHHLGASMLRVLAGAAVVTLGLSTAACYSGRKVYSEVGALPSDLPAEPMPCAEYCRVWVPPVYRDRPVLEQVSPGGMRQVPQLVHEVTYEEVEVRAPEEHCYCLPGNRCTQAVVEVHGGGWKWKKDGNCWKYCYEPPEYTRCEKTVGEDSISYCAETPAEYETVAHGRDVMRSRCEYVAPEYRTVWVKEIYQPGHWEWRVRRGCESCICGDCSRGISGGPPATTGLAPCCERCN